MCLHTLIMMSAEKNPARSRNPFYISLAYREMSKLPFLMCSLITIYRLHFHRINYYNNCLAKFLFAPTISMPRWNDCEQMARGCGELLTPHVRFFPLQNLSFSSTISTLSSIYGSLGAIGKPLTLRYPGIKFL